MSRAFLIAFFLFVSIKAFNAQSVSHDSIKVSKSPPASEVKLIDFSTALVGDKVKLKWSTASEKNVKEFYIYRSIDEVNWYIVVNLPVKANSATEKNYEALDKTASGGINFYKLAFIDPDGNAAVLKIVKIDMEDKSKEIKVMPDNISSTLKLESAEQIISMDLELTDILERSYFVNFVTDNTHEITIITGPLSPGTYFLKCYLNKNRQAVKKVIIVKN